MKVAGYLLVGILSAAVGAGAMHLSKDGSSRYQGSAKLDSIAQLAPDEAAHLFLPSLLDSLSGRVVAFTAGGGMESHQGLEDAIADDISFRLRATAYGFGLCAADNLGIGLESVAQGSGSKTVQPDGSIRIRQSYRVVGDTTPDKVWNDTYEAELNSICAAQGVNATFFYLGPGADPRGLADILPALRNAPPNIEIKCQGNGEACRSPGDILRSLDPGRLILVTSSLDCEETDQTCLELVYMAEQGTDTHSLVAAPRWVVKAKGRYRGAYSTGMGKLVLSEIEISYN